MAENVLIILVLEGDGLSSLNVVMAGMSGWRLPFNCLMVAKCVKISSNCC